MLASLQNKCEFSLLGSYVADCSAYGQWAVYGNDEKTCRNLATNGQCLSRSPNARANNFGSLRCGCHKLDGLSEQLGPTGLGITWIKLLCGLTETVGQRIRIVPKFDHLHKLHLKGETVFQLDIHVIVYDIPTFNGHHYCLGLQGSFNSCTTPCKKPKSFDNLHEKDSHLNLDTVILAMNSANAAQMFLSRCLNAKSSIRFRIIHTSQTCVEFAEKAAFQMHLMWSNIVVDIFLGNLYGIVLWYLSEPSCLWVSSCAHDITNHCLRTSIWLMGNPAGFKLNTELAGVLGMISLNGIQIWSTLWVFMSFLFIHFLKGLAICGIFFGLTTAAALIIYTISIATIHVLTLHLFLSFSIHLRYRLWQHYGDSSGLLYTNPSFLL
ncbi:uncharacterized protein [Henckelia pumila]|uniref:uncharacterized protein isoform X2 n=1 Tax=Henckelia pumila TaxID=405737 RepID=UPI003C6DFF35